MTKTPILVTLAVGTALTLGACQSMNPHESRVLTGAGLGAAGGAVVGGLASGTAGGAVVGGAVGGMAGAIIADVTDRNGHHVCYARDARGQRYQVPCR